ncbi:hypothetical protein FPV67DRAFT_1564460 [Lyophyllum atratum]|nr:hypothetical protein FPV67DRAFT_1564460 [Lyophyllum atratum]
MEAFVETLLGYTAHGRNLAGGVLGVPKGYYGVVEVQGRGTLHCHMLVWLEGALNPNEIKDRILAGNSDEFQRRLIEYLDDAISTEVPEPPPNPREVPSSKFRAAAVRGLNGLDHPTEDDDAMDLHNVVAQCQIHRHSPTCYKYSTAKTGQCRFDLDASNYVPLTTIDPETGVLTLRCLDGLVNDFNATVIKTMRCNMDIKFIGSGDCAKAVLYYITNYIAKSQLKTHVAYAALELAVGRLGEEIPGDDLKTEKAKKMLQKCAHAMISHQELSAQQVCSSLLGFGENMTSHEYRKFYWTSFEGYIDSQLPSPECYRTENGTQAATDYDRPETDNEDESDDLAKDAVDNDEVSIDVDDCGEMHCGISRRRSIK